MAKGKTSPAPRTVPGDSGVITKRKRAEEALRESEERFRLLAEHAQDIVFRYRLTEPRGYEYVSPAVMAIGGFSPDEFYGDPDFDSKVIHPDSRGAFEQMVRERLTDPVELRWVRKDGSVIWTEQRNVPVYDGNGSLIAVEGIVRDITERKRAEEALRQSEAKWRSLVENAPDIISTVDRDGIIQFINRTVPGMSVEEAIGSSVYDYAPPEEHATMREAYERVFRTGEPVSYESTGLGPDGTTSWYSVRVGPIKREGQVVALTVIATDITERKRTEEALRESEERLRTVISSAPIVIWALDPDGVFTLSDGKGLEALGLKPGEVVGRSVFDVYRDVPEIVENNRRALAGEDFAATLDIEGFGSTWEARYSPCRDQNGAVAGIIGVAIDISERKRMKEALRQAREELEGKVERQMVRKNPYGLTFREFTVLHLVVAGRADKEIACELGISPLTVHKHVSNILAKMDAASRTDAGVRAVREGLLD